MRSLRDYIVENQSGPFIDADSVSDVSMDSDCDFINLIINAETIASYLIGSVSVRNICTNMDSTRFVIENSTYQFRDVWFLFYKYGEEWRISYVYDGIRLEKHKILNKVIHV